MLTFAPRFLVRAASLVICAAGAHAQSWTEVKCTRYAEASARLFSQRDLRGVGREFLERHRAFLESRCAEGRDICPGSPEEIALADALTIIAVNGGTAGTFLPFACRR